MTAVTSPRPHPPSTAATRGSARARRQDLANLSTAELYERAMRDGEGMIAAEGPLVVRTGTHTGRSPKDKFIVREPSSEANVWWGDVNHPISRGALRPPPRAPHGATSPSAGCTPRTCSSARTRATGARSASTPRRPGRASSPATCSAGRPREELASFAPELHDHRRAVVRGGSGDRGHPHRDRDPRPPPADGDHHRRARCTPARSRSRRSRS